MWFKAKKKLEPLEIVVDSRDDIEVLNLVNDALNSIINTSKPRLSANGSRGLSAILYRHADQLCSPSDREDGL